MVIQHTEGGNIQPAIRIEPLQHLVLTTST